MAEKWIDVSAHNGVINWPLVAGAGIKGAILRAGYGNDISQTDKQFTANIKGAIATGLKVAVYWFGYPESEADAQAEFAVCKQVIEPYRGSILFICYDYEYDSASYYNRMHGADPSKSLINAMVNTFLSAAKKDGWRTSLYSNNDYRLHVFTTATLSAWDYLWLADYTGSPDVPCAIQQTGSSGTVPGISGSVDMDTVFVIIALYTCDTSGTVMIALGSSYTVKTTGNIELVAGTQGRVQIIKCIWPEFILWHIVPLGKTGQKVGIYPKGSSDKLFTVAIQ